MVLKTRSWSLLTMLSSSSPSDAMALVNVYGAWLLTGSACAQTGKQHGFGMEKELQSVREHTMWCGVQMEDRRGSVADAGFVGTRGS